MRLLFNSATGRLVGRPFVAAWQELQASYRRTYPQFPAAPQVRVRNVNDEATLDALLQYAPDLVIVSGTNLVGKRVIEAAGRRLGVVNMHTGISPYVKGGPNCTNWCISTLQFDKIGNTIMWINEGIDSGNIITTECTSIIDRESLDAVHWQVMEHAHDLYLRSIAYLLKASQPYQSIAQKDIAKGELYLTRMWNFKAKKNLLTNWKRFTRFRASENNSSLITIPLR